MLRKIVLFFFLLVYSLNYAQYDWTPGKLILKNGKSLKGLFKIPMDSNYPISVFKNKLQYKKDKKSKKKKFDKTQVHKLFFSTFNQDLGYYEYIPISRKKMALFKLIRNGKVKLYIRTIKIFNYSTYQNPNGPFPQNQTTYKTADEFYMIRKNETVATNVLQKSDGLSLGHKANLMTFKNDMKKYFADCEDVVSYIENDIYEDFDTEQIVDDYNLLCE